MIRIEQVPAAVVWPVRHRVMYPHQALDSVQLAEDAEGIHLALYDGTELVSVLSLFEEGDELQFRKFATMQEYQGKGYGSRLLEHVVGYARQRGLTRIWCNARKSAASFYRRFGFRETTGEVFFKNGIAYVIMELRAPES